MITIEDDLLGSTESEESPNFRHDYALYTYKLTQGSPEPSLLPLDKPAEPSLDNFSLSLDLLHSSLSVDLELHFRENLATFLPKASIYSNDGKISTLDIAEYLSPAMYYYQLIQPSDDSEGSSSSTSLRLQQPYDKLPANYVVCLICNCKQGLELFRSELEGFCEQLKPVIQSNPPVKGSIANSPLGALLKGWYFNNVQYLSRCVERCYPVLAELLHVAVKANATITGTDKQLIVDIQRFIESSTLSLLMPFPKATEDDKDTVIEVTSEGCTFSSYEHSKFCSDWAQVLLSQGATNTDPFFLKQAVENFKLKIIQDINAFKRILQRAETDYYQLYRSYLFLCACGNGKLLVECAMNEANSLTDSSSTLAVLKVLQEYTRRNGFRSVKSIQF